MSTVEAEPIVRKAIPEDFAGIRWLFDTYSSGVYGFVPDARIRTEMQRGGVHVVELDSEIVAAAIGSEGGTLWNIMVDPKHRHQHLGSLLVEAIQPQRIRVKCRPHKSMSREEQRRFVDPTPFYERLGFVFEAWDYPRQVTHGRDPLTFKARVKGKGDTKSVKIMRKLGPAEKGPPPDLTPGPRVSATARDSNPRGPRVRPS